MNPAFESRRPTDLGWAIDCTATAACIRVLLGWGNLAGPRGGLNGRRAFTSMGRIDAAVKWRESRDLRGEK